MQLRLLSDVAGHVPQGRYAIGGGHVSVSHPSGATTEVARRLAHLVPVAEPLPCDTCEGTGIIGGGTGECDPFPCAHCEGDGFFRGTVELTVECEQCNETGNVLEWFEGRNGHKHPTYGPCHEHDPGQKRRRVGSAFIEDVLPIVAFSQDPEAAGYHEVCWMNRNSLVMWNHGTFTDVSHLSAFFATSGFAVILTGVET